MLAMVFPQFLVLGVDVDHDFAGFNFHLIGLEVHADRRTLCSARSIIKSAIMFGAFDNVIHHQAIGQVNFLMCTQAVVA